MPGAVWIRDRVIVDRPQHVGERALWGDVVELRRDYQRVPRWRRTTADHQPLMTATADVGPTHVLMIRDRSVVLSTRLNRGLQLREVMPGMSPIGT